MSLSMYVTDLFGDPVENDDDKNDKNHVSKSSSKLSLESNLKADKTKSHIKTPNTQNRMLSAQNQSTSYGDQDAIYRNQMSSYQSNQDADDYVTTDTPNTHATHKYRQNDFQQIEIDPHKLIDGLNEQQSKAVQYKGSALLIGAGAGSGKTRVLTRRIAWILSQFHEWPSHILAITFTNKAAQEMRERLATLIGNEALNMWVSTFHSACVKILRRDGGMIGLKPGFSIYDSSDSERLIKQIETDLNIDIKRFTPKVLRGKISDFKNSLITWQDQLEAYAPDYHVGVGGQKISKVGQSESLYATVYAEYQYRLSIANAVDFDDLIMRTVELMRKVPQVAQKYRRKFRYILVDEYQDTNHAQYVLIRELSGVDAQVKGSAGSAGSASAQVSESSGSSESTQNVSKTVSQHVLSPASITVVGDSDQSIYAFRGADIRNIQDFEEDFPDAKTIMLEQNYRSTQTILDAANAVISHNQERKPKKLWTALGKGDPIIGYGAQNSSQEGLWIAEEISRLKTKENIPYSNIAIMYRANAQSRALEDALIKSGLPYQLVGGTKFYERKEVKDTLAYMQSIVNPDDDINMRRIFNVPKRGLGNRAESLLLSYAKAQGISFWNSIEQCENISGMPTRSITQIKAFHTLMCELTQMAIKNDSRPSIIVKNILDSTGLLDELKRSEDEQDLNRVENLSQLQSVASEYEQNADEVTLAGFLEQTALVADSDQLPTSSEDTGKITLMTLHTAKGLEYPVVFLTGMEQGTFPHSRSMDNESELSEERRLAYVGITRAKQRLYLTYASVRSQWGDAMDMIPSQFLDEIPEDLIHWNSKKPSYDYDSDDDFDDEVDDFDDDFDYDDDFIDDFDDSYASRTSFGSRAHKSSSSLKSAKTRKKSSSYGNSSRTSYGSSYGSSYSSSSRSSSYGSSSRSSYGSSYGSSSSYSSGSSYGSSYGSSKARFKSSSVTTRKSSITSSRSSSSSASRDNQVNRDNQLNIEDFHVGDKITHDQYGLGTIVATQDKGRNSIITVDFGSDGVKRLMLRVAPIEKL
ncbi:UvrD-helicase domain-containing protein [uncultured Gardnerella sp.]|uniref:ATP-dependent helicase n=1 Tax=uncultured Gardnerella sp. TaxID=293424 RepID=UPI00262398D8|nr:UvrD-helicase domain-containing protein [uncultured Gardnerella sp.]